MKKLVAVLLTFLLLLTGCNTVKVTKIKDEKQTDAIKFSSEYKTVSKNNKYKYIIYDNLVELLKKGTGIIYLSYPDCIECQSLALMLNHSAELKDVKKIYYYNFKEIKDNNTKEYKELLSILKDYVQDEITAPSIIFVKDGVIKEYYSLPSEEDDMNDLLSKYIDEIYNEEKVIIKDKK